MPKWHFTPTLTHNLPTMEHTIKKVKTSQDSEDVYTTLVTLIETDQKLCEDVANITQRTQALEDKMITLTSPLAITAQQTTDALTRAIDFAMSTKNRPDSLDVQMIYDNENSGEMAKYDLVFDRDNDKITGIWREGQPFEILGDVSESDPGEYPKLVQWNTFDQFQHEAFETVRNGKHGWTVKTVSYLTWWNSTNTVYERV